MSLIVDIEKKLSHYTLKVNFTVENENFGIMGSSGAGKSVTLKCIAGIMTPDSGVIIYNDKVFFDSSKKINLPPQERNVGYMFQSYALFPHMSVKQNIEAGLIAHKVKKEMIHQRVNDLLEAFHIEELKDRYPQHLSGGQKQRVALARLLAYQPDLILLDEPFSAMDRHLKKELQQELIKILKEYKRPSLMVSHDDEEIQLICDRYIFMEKGEIKNEENIM